MLWVLDLQVYHRLLDSCFIEALNIEEIYPWLPALRIRMMKSQEGTGVINKIIVFYIVPIALLVLVAVYFLSSWVYEEAGLRGAVPVVLAGVAIDVAVGRYILRTTLNTNRLRNKLLQLQA